MPAVFLDRDGTLVRDVCHGADPAAMEVLPGTVEALVALSAAGYALVVVTNQSGIARGLFTHGEAHAMGSRLAALLQPHGVRLAGHYHCPHHIDGRIPDLAVPCDCRKPAPGMLLRAARELDLDLERSWIIGDMLSDIGAGVAAGTRTVLVDNGHLALTSDVSPPIIVSRNIAHAATIILAADGHIATQVEACRRGVLHRAVPLPEPEVTGVASPWPDADRLAQARVDAERLREAVIRSSVDGRR